MEMRRSSGGYATSLLGGSIGGGYRASDQERPGDDDAGVTKNKLGTMNGVIIPCLLSIFGAILFLRLSWGVGNTGFVGVFSIFALAGFMVTLTALSISAISTNGSMKGGGAYYMISRSLGPEFGASVGVVFYLANAVGVTFYITAFTENMTDSFLEDASFLETLLISSSALALVLVSSLVGASFFSKLNVVVFGVLVVSISCAAISFLGNDLSRSPVGYTGPSMDTLKDNWSFDYDYMRDEDNEYIYPLKRNGYFDVFSVIFPAVTGIMAGANLSGDLEDPGASIGSGTLKAIAFAVTVYVSLALLIAMSVSHEALIDNTSIMQDSCFSRWPIIIGVIASTLSSALGSLVGGARILQALARDNIIPITRPFAVGTAQGDEPVRGVLLTWGIAQAGLLIGSLDVVAGVITNCFLLTYFFTNFACFVLRVSGAPNFRPTFKYFSWHTALLGALLCLVIMFLCDVVYASVSILLLLLVFSYVLYAAPVMPWGDVSQALIFHQVRKYLLRLDSRKDHPKFWRPSVLLLLRQPGHEALISFCNDLKKGGLYIVGSVVEGDAVSNGGMVRRLTQSWVEYIAAVGAKAFCEVTLAPSMRVGAQGLMLTCGLGGMKPNTVVFPFPEPLAGSGGAGGASGGGGGVSINRGAAGGASMRGSDFSVSAQQLSKKGRGQRKKQQDMEAATQHMTTLVQLDTQHRVGRPGGDERGELVSMLADALALQKNIVLARNFTRRSMPPASGPDPPTIDVWVVGPLAPSDTEDFTGTLALQLQLAHVLTRTDSWSHVSMRVMRVVERADGMDLDRAALERMLRFVRVQATVVVLPCPPSDAAAGAAGAGAGTAEGQGQGLRAQNPVLNTLIREHSGHAGVCFLALPPPPPPSVEVADTAAAVETYFNTLDVLTHDTPPMLLCLPGSEAPIITTEL